MADYAQHISRLAPQLYLPLDDVAPSVACRQIGSLTGVTATYNSGVKRTHGPIDATGAGRGGAMTYGVAAPVATETAWGVETTTFDNTGAGTTGYTLAWWQRLKHYGQFRSGNLWIADASYTTASATCWLFNPYSDGLSYFYGASGALVRAAAAAGAKWGHWVHWAYVWSPSVQTFYRNGNVHWTQTVARTNAGHALSKLRIFADLDSAMAHVAYWNRPITQAEARSMYRLRGT